MFGFDPNAINLELLLQAPVWGHGMELWLGTDDLGRSVLARLLAGLGLSISVAVAVWVITFSIGVVLGLVAGWTHGGKYGWVDGLINKLCDVLLSFPGLLMALALTALMGPSAVNVVLALGLLGWVGFCRLTRIQVMALRQRPFVLAAQLGGIRLPRILGRHLLPNLSAPLVVESVLVLGGAMVAEAGLSFLGLGVPAPQASLGGMLRDGARYMVVAPHLVAAPAVVLIGLTVTANVLAEALRRRLGGGKN